MPETCENWPNLVHNCVYNAHQTQEILPGTAFLSVFKSSQGALKSTE